MPKALVPVMEKPLLWHIIHKLKAAGFERIVVNVHHFAEQIINYLAANENFGIDIRISDERQQLLDTGGGIKHARPLFDPQSPVLIHNVDILSNADLNTLYQQALTQQAAAVLLVSPRQSSRALFFDTTTHNLLGWENLTTGERRGPIAETPVPADGMMQRAFSGIHVITPALLQSMETWPDCFGIIDFYLMACRQNAIRAIDDTNLRLLDIGKPDALAKAEAFLNNL